MDEELITDWFDTYADDIYKFSVYYMATHDVQEVFIKAIDHYGSFKNKAKNVAFTISIR